jgi:hypothetical protein
MLKRVQFSMLVLIAGCAGSKMAEDASKVSYAGPPVIVYKTVEDYSGYVAVMMNEEKTEIVSYPAPSDIRNQTNMGKPVKLDKGYLLDNRGISTNTVFLDISLTDYAMLQQPPSLEEMQRMIKRKEPFSEMYNLGVRGRFKDEVKEINRIIRANTLSSYKVLISQIR